MRRREFLAAAAGLAATAGCTTRALDPGGSPTATTRGTTQTTDRTAGTTGDSGRACPSFLAAADRTVCYDGRGDADVYLEPSETRFVEYAADDAVQTTSFRLHNGGDRAFELDVNDWAVKRRTDDGWRHVAPDDHVDAIGEISPGSSYEWVLSTQPHSSPMSEDSRSVVVDLESAETYAFRVHGTVDGTRVECVARFVHLRAVPGE